MTLMRPNWSVPEGYTWPEDCRSPLWEASRPRPHHHSVEFNQACIDLGFRPHAERSEDLLHELYSLRCGHFHAVYGQLEPPQRFRGRGGLVGPVLSLEDRRCVYADLRGGDRITGYVSALRIDDDRLGGTLPFAADLEELALIIDWERGRPAGAVDYWDLSGGGEAFGGPRLR